MDVNTGQNIQNCISDTLKFQNLLPTVAIFSTPKTKNLPTALLPQPLMPADSTDPVCAMHQSYLHTAFLCIDLQNAIRYQDGPYIFHLWKLRLPRLVGTRSKNYATECVCMISGLCANLPRHLVYIATHDRTVNMVGQPG